MRLDAVEVGGTDRGGVDVEAAALDFEAAEVVEFVEGKGQFLLGHEVKYDQLVMFEAEVMQGIFDRFGIVEKIADHDDEATGWDAFGDFVKSGGAARVVLRGRCGEGFEDRPDLARFGGGPQVGLDRFVKGDETDGVLLADEQVGQSRGEVASVFEFGEVRLSPERSGLFPGVAHRSRGVDEQGDPHVRLFDVLLDIIAITFAVDPPVEIPEIIPSDILPMFREFHGESFVRTGVASVDGSFFCATREEFEPTDHVDDLGRQHFAELWLGCLRHEAGVRESQIKLPDPPTAGNALPSDSRCHRW